MVGFWFVYVFYVKSVYQLIVDVGVIGLEMEMCDGWLVFVNGVQLGSVQVYLFVDMGLFSEVIFQFVCDNLIDECWWLLIDYVDV